MKYRDRLAEIKTINHFMEYGALSKEIDNCCGLYMYTTSIENEWLFNNLIVNSQLLTKTLGGGLWFKNVRS